MIASQLLPLLIGSTSMTPMASNMAPTTWVLPNFNLNGFAALGGMSAGGQNEYQTVAVPQNLCGFTLGVRLPAALTLVQRLRCHKVRAILCRIIWAFLCQITNCGRSNDGPDLPDRSKLRRILDGIKHPDTPCWKTIRRSQTRSIVWRMDESTRSIVFVRSASMPINNQCIR